MPELAPCKHCHETGTCNNGKNKSSCVACVLAHIRGFNPMESDKMFDGLSCSVCGGIGQDEPTTFKWHNRFLPILTCAFVAGAVILILVFGLMQHPQFDKVLVFTSTLVGSITGYYYGGAKVRTTLRPESSEKDKTKTSTTGAPPPSDAA